MDTNSLLDRANALVTRDPKAPICQHFHDWPIEDYLSLYLNDLSAYPLLAKRLPKMPPEADQRRLTWSAGAEIVKSNVVFSRTSKAIYEATGKRLRDATVLDYGAGWGRLTRMMLQFIPGDRVLACDANPSTVNLFNSLNFETECVKISIAPTESPFGPVDFVWLWSILTHLPEHIADTVMHSLRSFVKPDGVLLVTIWPKTFWTTNPLVAGKPGEDMVALHEGHGFAHKAESPHWGNTSMSLDYLTSKWPHWRVVRVHEEVTQQMVYLAPR
jgi:hypothetical protein